MAMKFSPASFASALAISVLEQPGGPYSRMPLGGLILKRVKISGCYFRTFLIIGSYSYKVK